jgi:uncharacterized membrane protein
MVIIALALALRLYGLSNQSFWLDEIFSLRDASLGESLVGSGMLSRLHGPLYFLALHFWANLGQSDFLLRMLSAFLGVGTVIAIYFLGKALFDERAGLLGAFVLSISPMHIWYSQELRMYVLLVLSSVVAIFFFVKAVEENSHRYWFWYVFSTAASLYSNPSAVFLLFSQWIFLIITRKTNPAVIKRFLAYQSLVFVAVTPWLVGIITKLASSPAWVGLSNVGRPNYSGNFPLAAIGYIPFTFSVGYSVGPSISELHESLALNQLVPHALLLAPLLLVFGATFTNGLRFLRRHGQKFLLLILLLIVPIISVITLSMVSKMPLNVRYTMTAFPSFILLVGSGIAGFEDKRTKIVVLALIVLASAYSLYNYYFNDKYAKEDSRSVASYIMTKSQAGDVILVTSSREPLNYYYKGNLTVTGLYATETASKEKMNEAIRRKTAGHSRVWLVLFRTWEIGSGDSVREYFDGNHSLADERAFSGVRVFLYN